MTRRNFLKGFAAVAVAHFAYQWVTAFTPSPNPTMEQITAAGGNAFSLKDGRLVEYFVHGDVNGKKTLIALHGAQTTGKLFDLLADWAKKNDVRIIAPTLPGYGLTTFNAKSYAPEDWVADAVELLDNLKVGSFAILGTSLGSIYAVALAAKYPRPADVLNIELYVPIAPFAAGEYDPLKGSMLDTFGKMRTTPHWKRFMEKIFFLPLIYYISPQGSDVRRAIETQWEGMNACADIIYHPWPNGWQSISNGERKIVIVSGLGDQAAPPHNQERLMQLLPGSELVTYDGPHEHSLKNPSLFAEHVSLIV